MFRLNHNESLLNLLGNKNSLDFNLLGIEDSLDFVPNFSLDPNDTSFGIHGNISSKEELPRN